MIIEGVYKDEFTGRLKEGNEFIFNGLKQGYRVREVKTKIDWPYFWRYRYTVTMVKDIIVDQKHIIETPLKELL